MLNIGTKATYTLKGRSGNMVTRTDTIQGVDTINGEVRSYRFHMVGNIVAANVVAA